MIKPDMKKAAAILLFALALSGCHNKGGSISLPKDDTEATADETEKETTADETEEETLPPEQMDLIKYNYYVMLNNDIIEVLDSLDYYFDVIDYTEEFSLLPDTGLTYGYRIYGQNTDVLEDCLTLTDMDPDYGELDTMIKDMADPLRDLMETFSAISRSNDYADNQYQKAKEYHEKIYAVAENFTVLADEYTTAIAELGAEKTAEDEAKMKEEGNLIIYNASRAISISKEVLNVIDAQDITDENITELDLTEIRPLYDELVAVVADFDAATADNDQLIKESLSNSRPFDGLLDGQIQALEWMMRQVESGRPLDLSGSGAPLGSIGHFSETLSKCIERYNSVFVE